LFYSQSKRGDEKTRTSDNNRGIATRHVTVITKTPGRKGRIKEERKRREEKSMWCGRGVVYFVEARVTKPVSRKNTAT